MKKTLKRYLFAICASFLFISCNKNATDIGIDLLPEGDRIATKTSTVSVPVKNVINENKLTFSTSSVLGNISDGIYGFTKASFGTQFFYPKKADFNEGFKQIDSVKTIIYYSKGIGDSKNPLEVSIYRASKEFSKPYEIRKGNLSEFYKSSDFVGKINTYPIQIPDSIKNQNNNLKSISIMIDKKIGEEIYKWTKDNKNHTNEDFNKFFKGLIFVPTNGNSTFFKIETASLDIYYSYADKESQKANELRKGIFQLTYTPEVKKLIGIETGTEQLIAGANDSEAYITSPMGAICQFDINLSEIGSKQVDKVINAIQLDIDVVKDKKSSLTPPPTILLINKDSVNNFFINKRQNDNVTSFISEYNKKTNKYRFFNIANIYNEYQKQLSKGKKISDKQTFVLIPVDSKTLRFSGEKDKIKQCFNELFPYATTLKLKNSSFNLEVITTNL